MNKKLIVIVSSVVVSILLFWFLSSRPQNCDGFGCISQAIGSFVIYLFVPVIVFGIIGLIWGEGRGWRQALVFAGIALLVAFVLMIPNFIGNRIEAGRKDAQEREQTLQRYRENPEQFKTPPPGASL